MNSNKLRVVRCGVDLVFTLCRMNRSLSAVASTVPIAALATAFLTDIVYASVARPGRGHACSRLIATKANEAEVVVFRYSLSKLPQDIVVDVAFFTTTLEKGSTMSKAIWSIIFWKKIGADREEDRVGICIGMQVFLRTEPVKDSKRNLECL